MGDHISNLTGLPSTLGSPVSTIIEKANAVRGAVVLYGPDENILWINDAQRQVMPCGDYTRLSYRGLFWRALEANMVGNAAARARPHDWIEISCMERAGNAYMQSINSYSWGAMVLTDQRFDDGSSMQIRFPVDAHGVVGLSTSLLDLTLSRAVEASALRQALDCLTVGVAVLSSEGRTLYANAALVDALRSGTYLRDDCGVLGPTDVIAAGAWQQAVRVAATALRPAMILLRDGRGRGAAVGCVCGGVQPGTVLVLVAPVRSQYPSATRHISEMLGVGQREAEVMGLLAQGKTVREIAEMHGVAEDTAYQQVASAKRKLRRVDLPAENQTALAVLFMQIAAITRPI